MRLFWMRVGPKSNSRVLGREKRGRLEMHRHKEKQKEGPYEARQWLEGGSPKPRDPRDRQLQEAGQTLPQSLQREPGPASTSMSGFWLQNWERRNF